MAMCKEINKELVSKDRRPWMMIRRMKTSMFRSTSMKEKGFRGKVDLKKGKMLMESLELLTGRENLIKKE